MIITTTNYNMKMKVYDCFTFFNELELLELRLNELDPVVDKFVLVEATRTYQNKEKPLYFNENKKRFDKFKDKIIHIIVDQYPENISSPWVLENYQRNKIIGGLVDCKPDDVIIISDLDEIPDPQKIVSNKDTDSIKIFAGRMFYYFLNFAQKNGVWIGSAMIKYKYLTTPQNLRNLVISYAETQNSLLIPRLKGIFLSHIFTILYKLKGQHIKIVKDGLWHFSYLGGTQRIIKKIEAFAHQEYNTKEYKSEKRIEEAIYSRKTIFGGNIELEPIPIDETFPKYLRNNLNKFSQFIIDVKK